MVLNKIIIMKTKAQLEAILEVLEDINDDCSHCYCEYHQDLIFDKIDEIEEELKQLNRE